MNKDTEFIVDKVTDCMAKAELCETLLIDLIGILTEKGIISKEDVTKAVTESIKKVLKTQGEYDE